MKTQLLEFLEWLDQLTIGNDTNEELVDKFLRDKKSDIEERAFKFKMKARGDNGIYIEAYGADIIDEFVCYWTEKNENGKKMRFEKEKTFDIKKRLARWKKNQEKFGGNNTMSLDYD